MAEYLQAYTESIRPH